MTARPSTLIAPALLASLTLLTGCSDPEPPVAVGTFELLSRRPDTVMDQPGRLVPSADERWGDLAISGWENQVEDRGPDGKELALAGGETGLAVWSGSRTARLRLPAGPAVDRTLEIEAWTADPPEGETPTRMRVELNDVELADGLEVGAALETYRVLAPGPAWQHGENVLALTVDRMHTGDSGGRGLAVCRVEYDEVSNVTVDVEDRALALTANTGATYFIELRSPGRLDIAGAASGPGELEVDFEWMEPATGEISDLGEPLALRAEAGAVSWSTPLPRPDGRVLRCRLLWRADPAQRDARLALERLRVEESAPKPRPPIIFVSVDTLAARNMSLYGYGRPTTPRLEEWAAECVVFENAKSNAPWTIPSYLSQMTGVLPRSHRFDPEQTPKRLRKDDHRPNIWELYQLTPNRWTLAEMIRAAGYRTAGFVDNLWLTRVPGFSQGFDVYDDTATQSSIEDPDGGMRTVFPRALEWLGELESSDPFFLFAQILDCHGPYLPNDEFRGRFAPGDTPDRDLVAPIAYTTPPTFGTIPDYIARSVVPEEVELPHTMTAAPLISAYDEKILEVDDYVGWFLDELRSLPFYDDAVIVFSADHGESMIEHDFLFRHGTVYEEAVNVPLIIKMPGGARGGTRVTHSVQLTDLYATLAELIGVPADRDWLHGRSLAPLLRGDDAAEVPVVVHGNLFTQTSVELDGWKLVRFHPYDGNIRTLWTHSVFDEYLEHTREHYGAEGELHPIEWGDNLFDREKAKKLQAATKDLAHLIKNFYRERGDYFELYNLDDDPGELANVAAQHPQRVAELLVWMEQADRDADLARERAAFSTVLAPMSESSLDELRRLGYVDEEDEGAEEDGEGGQNEEDGH